MKLSNLALFVIAASLTGCGQAQADKVAVDTASYQQPGGFMYFFEQGIPKTLTASDDKAITLTSKYVKDGENNLAWRFEPGSVLTFSQPVGYKDFVANDSDQSVSTFSAWVYNEEPQQEKVTFVFGTDGEDLASFDINFNFKGWRHLLIPFKDMNGTPDEAMNFMQVRVPDSIKPGTLYFDQVMPSIPADPRWPTRDEVVPYINLAADSAPNRHWLAHYRYNGFMKEATKELSQQTINAQDVKAINEKLESFILAGKKKQPDLADLHTRVGQFELEDLGDYVKGKTIGNGNRLKIFLDKGVNKGLLNDDGFETVFDVIDIREYSELILALTLAMQSDISAAEQQELTDMYILLTRFGLDQGYEAGSGLGTSHHIGYGLRALFEAHFINRELLAQNNLLSDVSEMMAWYSNAGRIYTPDEEFKNFNVDIMNTQLRAMLYSILMQPDEQQKTARLEQFSRWLSKSVVTSEGLGGGFKPDGSVFHHAQHYPAYASGALKGLTPVVDALSRTSYAVDETAHAMLKHVVAMGEIYSNDSLTLMSVAGRHPTGVNTIDLPPFMHMAMAGSPDGKQAIDRDMAEAYLRQVKKDDKFSRFLKKEGFEATSIASGNWAMNFASLNIQRRDGWIAAVRGFSRYLVGNESYANANRYGRYINYGQLEIMGAEGQQRAFSHDGWNWNRWPGITSVQLPYEELNAKLRNVDRFSGLEEMLMSEQTYVGGLSHQDNGMYAMKLQGHPKYDASFYANKSVFFFDNRIVALGSDIASKDQRFPTQTTLFQHAVRTDEDKTRVNNDSLIAGVKTVDATNKTTTVVMDPANNAYFVAGGQEVAVTVDEQDSVHQKTSKPTKGKFATAVLDHGNAPESGSYQYAILVETNKSDADAFAEQLASEKQPYKVLAQDSTSHIVWDRETNTTAYALFEVSENLNDALIQAVDSPSMVMATPVAETLSLSVVNPDFNLYQGKDETQYDGKGVQQEVSIYSRGWKDTPSQPLITTLTLKGEWKSANALPQGSTLNVQQDGTTLLSVTTVNAESVDINLVRS